MKYTKGEFITIPNKSALRGLSPNLQVLFLWLCDHSDDNMQCFPSRRTLAAECGISTDTLDRGMRKLVELGMIRKTKRNNSSGQTSNLYECVVLDAESSTQPQIAPPQPQKQDGGSRKNRTRNSNQLTQPNELKTTNVVMSTKADVPTISDFFYMIVAKLGFSDQVRLTDKRQALLKRRLKTFKASEILRAAQAISTDPYLQGDNPSGRRYGDIDYLLRSDEQIDKFLQKAELKLTEGAF